MLLPFCFGQEHDLMAALRRQRTADMLELAGKILMGEQDLHRAS